MNENDPPGSYIWGTGTQLVNCFRQIRKCYLVEDMSLMVAFKVWKKPQQALCQSQSPPLSSFSSLWIEYNLSATDLVLYLFAGHHISHHEDHGLTLWNYKQTPKSMLYLPWLWYVIDNNKKVTKKMSACNSRDKVQDKWLLKNFWTARVDKPLNSRFSEELYLKYKQELQSVFYFSLQPYTDTHTDTHTPH